MRVLIVTEHTADDRKTLATVRAVAREGAEVIVANDGRRCVPAWSRYCRQRLVCPDPITDWQGFSSWLGERMLAREYDVVLPFSDYPTMAVVRQQDRARPGFGHPVPPPDAMDIAHDKLRTLELAASLGIGTPRTWSPGSAEEVEEIARSIEFPCVLKLRRGAGAVGLSFPASAGELMANFQSLDTHRDAVFSAHRPLVQEFVPGRVHDASMLFNAGEPRVAMTQIRLATHPAGAGVGIWNVTTDEADVREQAVALLGALKWHGPAQVEFKRDARNGSLKLMEINARYWGALGLAIHAGINVPWLACRMALDGDVDRVDRYRVGLHYRWNWTFGIRHVLASETPLRAFRDFYLPARDTVSEFRWSDPLPHLVAAMQ